MKTYYVYTISFTDSTYYIGYRGACQDPKSDLLVKYFTSSKAVKEKLKICEHSSSIIYSGLSKEDAYNKEQELISKHISNPLCLNERCYYGRDGFGIISQSAKLKISKTSKERWNDPVYKQRVIDAQKERWLLNPELKEKQSARLTGKKRPEHSAKLKGHPGHDKCKGVKKHDGFGAKVSASLLGKTKSHQHKLNLSGPKPRICRLTDKKEMSVNHYTRWIKSLLS